jgi:hypothetical protein
VSEYHHMTQGLDDARLDGHRWIPARRRVWLIALIAAIFGRR